MTITYQLLPNPKWYIADLNGKPLGAGSMFTYRSLDKTQFKFIYQDPAGNFPWTDPVLFDANGSQGPFYWAVDSLNPNETYFIQVFDINGVLQWTIDNFGPATAGGGGNVTTAINLENLVINPVFWRNLGQTANPVAADFTSASNNITTLAPGAHSGFGGTSFPDITFVKTTASTATDQITFNLFNSNALTSDVTPEYFLTYFCSNNPTGETTKEIRYPINVHNQAFNNVAVSITIWAQCTAGNTALTLSFLQTWGDGTAASLPTVTPIQTLALTAAWQKFIIPTTVPPLAGSTVGACGNDALYLVVQLPLGAATTTNHTKLSMYLGNIAPTEDFIEYDNIDATINSPRTGDTRSTVNNFAPFGWVPLNDGTIGAPASNATTRQNKDTFPLYDLIWNNVSQTYAPLYNSAGVLTARGADAATDFSNSNQLSLTRQLGRVIAGTTEPQIAKVFTVAFPSPNMTFSSGTTAKFFTGVPVVVSTTGTLPLPLKVNTTYFVINISSTVIQLALTYADATATIPVPIVFTTNGTGAQTVTVSAHVLGSTVGEETHVLTGFELTTHHHTIPGSVGATFAGGGAQGYQNFGGSSTDTSTSGQNDPFNEFQPTTFLNMFMKL